MSRDTSDLQSALRRYAAERRPTLGPHPDPDDLVAYARGDLDPPGGEPGGAQPDPAAARRGRIQEHLALCPECTEWLLDYQELDRPEPEETAGEIADEWRRQRGTAWDEIQRRIGGLGEGAAEGPGEVVELRRPSPQAPPAAPGHPAVQWWTTVVLAAACLLLAVLLWRARTEVQQPRPTEVVALAPAESGLLRGGARPDRVVVRPPPGHRLVVQLAYVGIGEEARFAAEIFPPTGEGAPWVVEVTRQGDEAFAVDLGTGPEPGQYRIVLYGFDGEESRQLATYGFRIGVAEPEEPPG